MGLGAKSLWWDESLSLHRARLDLPGILSNEITLTDSIQQVVTVDNHPPLYFLLLRLATQLFGESEFALRFPVAGLCGADRATSVRHRPAAHPARGIRPV